MARTKKKLQDEQRMELERFLAAQRRGGRGRGRGRPRGSGRGGGSQSHTYPAAIFRQPDTLPVIQPSPMAATQTNPELVSATSLPSATPVPSPCSPAMVNMCSSEQVSPRKIIPTVPKGSIMEGLALSSTKMPLKMKPTARKSTVPKRLLTSAAIHSANDSTGVSHTFPSTSGNDNCADMGNIFDIMMSSESPSKTGTGCRNLPEADLGQTVTVFNSVSQAVQNLRRGVKTPIVCMQDIFKYEKRGVKGAKISNPTMQCSQQSTSFTNYNTQKEGFGASESSKGKVGDSPGSKFCVKSQLPKANTDRQTSRVSDNPSTSGMSLGTECTRNSPVVSPNDKLTVPASPGRSPEKRKRSPNVRLGSDMFLFPWHRSRRPREKSSENKGDKKSGKNSVSSGVKILTNSISPGVKKLANSAPPGVKILTNSVSPGVKVLNKDSCNVKDSTTKCSLAQASSTSKSPLIEDSLPVPICTVSTCNAAKVKTGETLTECATEIGACVMELSSSEKVDIEMRTESQQSHTIKSDHSPIPDLKWNDKVNIESKVSCSTQTEQCVSQLKVKYECLPSTSAASDSEMIVGYCDDSIQNNTGELTDTSKIAGDSAAAHKKTDSRLLNLIDRMTARVGNPMKWQDLPSSSPNNEAICDEYDLHLSACSSPCEPPEEESFLEESPLDDTFMDKSPLEESSLKETSMDKSPLEESSSMEVSMDRSPLEELSLKESSMDKSSLKESSLKETSMHKSFLEELSLKEASMYKSSLEELSLKETSVDKSSLKQSSLKETFMDKSSLKESSLKETSMNKSPLEESSLKETSVDKSFLEESSLKEASMDKSSLEELSLKETSMDKSSLKEMSLKETSTDKSPLEESSLKETPTDKSFLEESFLKETSMDKTSLKELSSKETSTDKSPLDESSLKETSMDTSFLEESSLKEACTDKTSLKESSSKETSTDKSPLEESSLKETSMDTSFLEESSLKEACMDKTSLKESSSKETSMDTSFLEESSLKEACMDKSSLKESSFKEASFDHSSEEGLSLMEISGHESSLEESHFMETSKDKSSLGESSLKESSLGKSSLEVSSTDESCVKDSHVKSGHKPSTSSASLRHRDWGKIQSTELGEVRKLNKHVKVVELCSSGEIGTKTAVVKEPQNSPVDVNLSDITYTGSLKRSTIIEAMITNETEEIKHDGNVVTDKQLLENSALEFEEDTSEISLSVYTDVRLGKMANAVNQDDDLSYGQRTREPAPLSVLSRVESLSSPKRMSAFLSENLDSYLQSDENRKICLKPKESSFPGKHSCPDIIETVADDFPKDSDGFKAESTDYRMNPFNPDFDDVEGMLFVSFDTKEAMEAHIRIEKQNHWDDNNYHFLDMCKLHKAANLKKRLGISGKIPKFLREKEQNYRGIHMKWFKYLRLFNRELSKMTGKPMKFEKHLAKSLEKTNDITKIKGWKNKFVDCMSSGEVGVSNGLPLQQTGKLHWRTEQRLLRSLPPEDIKDMGLHLKKKRRKNMIFTHRKGSSAKFEGRVGRFGRVQKPRFGQDDEYYYGDEAKYYEDEGDVKKAKVDNVHIKTEEGNGTTGVPMKKPSLKKKLMKKYNLCGHKRLKKMWKRRLREGKLAALKQEEESEGLREEFPILTESMALHAVSVLDCNMLGLRPQNFNEVCPRENGADICSDKMATGDGRDDSVDCNLNKDRVDFEEDVGQSLCGKPGCRYGCVCHLFRDRTVPGSRGSDSDEVNKEETSTVCDKEYCRLGCICSSLERQLTDRDTHCRKAECMFNCHCEDKELTLHSLLSPSGSDDIPLLQAVTESLKSHETLKNLEPPEAAPARLTCPDLAEAEKKTTAVPKNRFAGLPKRVGSQRVAKNLDAITRKAMMYMDPDDLFPKPKRRHRKKDEITADEKTGRIKSLVVSQPTNEVVIYEQVDEAIEHGQMSSDDAIHTSPLGPLFGCSRTSIFNPVRKPRMHGCIKKNNTDKADVIDVVTDSPVHMEAEQPQEGSQFTDTVFIQKCFKNTAMTYDQFMNNVKPQEDLKLETVNNVISISDDDDDKVTLPVPPIPNITNPCPRPYTTQEDIQRRKKRKRKQRLEKTLLDGYGSPSKLSTELSNCTSDAVTTVKVPVWDDWSTNMVCIKASKKRKSVPNSEERKTSSEHHLLEIKSNCSWEASRKMVLSGVAKCLRPYEYPDPQEIEIQNYTVEILPKASEPAKIPPSFSANFPSVMYTVRITVSPTWFHRKNKKVEEPKKDKGPEMTASKQLCLRLLQEQQQKAALQQQQQKQELQKPVNGPTVLQQQQPVLQQMDPVQKSIVVDTPPTERRLKAKTRSDKIKNTGKHFQPASGISGLGKLKINNSFIQLNPNISQQNSVFRLQEGQVTFKSGLPPSASLATATAKTTSGLVLNTSNARGGFEDSINQTSSTVVTVSGTSALAMTHSKPSNHNATDAREITSLSSQNSNTTGSMPSPKPVGLRPDSLPTMQLIQNGAGMPKLVPLSAGKVGNMPLLQLVPMANTAGPRGTTPTAVRMQGQSGTTTSSVTSGNKNYVAFPVILQTVNPGSTSGGGTGAKANGGLTLRASGLPTGCVMAPTQSSVFPVKMGTEQRPVFLAPVTVQPANPGVIPTPISFTAHPAPTINSTNSDSQKHLDKDMDTVNSAGKTDKSENTVPGINLTGRRELYSVLTSSQAPSLIKSTSNQENKTPKEKSDLDNAAPDPCVHLRTGNSDIVCDISVIDSSASSTENSCSDDAQVKHLDSDQEIKNSPKLKTEANQSENDKPKVFRKEEVETSEVSLTSADSDGAKKSFVEVRSLLNMVASQSGVKETNTLSSDKPSEKPLTREIYGQDNFIDLTEENSDKTSCAIETSDMDVSVSKSLNDEKQCVELPAGIPNSGSSKYTLDLINIQKLIKKPLGFPSSNPHSIGLVDGLKQVSPTCESDNVAKSTTLSATENCADNCAEISSSAGVDSTFSASGINTRYTQDSGAPQGIGITEGGVSHADHTVPDKSQGVAKATTSSGALTSELDTYSLDSWSDVSNDGDSQQESRFAVDSLSDEERGQRSEEEEEVDVEVVSEEEGHKHQSKRKSPIMTKGKGMEVTYSERVVLMPSSSTNPQKMPSNRRLHLFRERKRRSENKIGFARLRCLLSGNKKLLETKSKLQILTEACALIQMLKEDQLALKEVLHSERIRWKSLRKQLACAKGLQASMNADVPVMEMDWHQTDKQTNQPDSRSFDKSSQSHRKVVESMTLDDGSSLQILLSEAESEADDSGETTAAVPVSQDESLEQAVAVRECVICESESSVTTPVHSPSITAPTTSIHHSNVKIPPKTDSKQNSVLKTQKFPGVSSAIKKSGVKKKEKFRSLEARANFSIVKQFGNDMLGEQNSEKTPVGKDLQVEKTPDIFVISSVSQKPAVDITKALIPSSAGKKPGKKYTTTADLKVQDPSVMSSIPVSAALKDNVITSEEINTVKLNVPVIEVSDDLSGDEQRSNVSSSVSGTAPVTHTGGLDYIIQSRNLTTDVNQQSVGVFDVESVFKKMHKKSEAEHSADSRISNSESLVRFPPVLYGQDGDSTEDSDVLVSETTCASLAKGSSEYPHLVSIDKGSCAESDVSCPGDGVCPSGDVGLVEPTDNESLVILDVCSLADWSVV